MSGERERELAWLHRSEQPDRWDRLATTLYDGDNTPRYREGIIRQVAASLRSAYTEGVQEGERQSRERALREMLAIARGLQQDAQRRVSDLERELAEYLRSVGKIPDV